MRFSDFPRSLARTLCVAALVALAPAADASAPLEMLVQQAQTAMEAREWEEALELQTQAIDQFGANLPLLTYGPQFGAIHYRKGICEMKLKRWSAAMASFEICYRDFPNRPGRRDNPFQALALLKWGEAAMGAGDWSLALNKFAKFTEERDRARDPFPQGAFYINQAVCYYHLGRIPEGNENMEIALANRLDFPTPASGILAGFQALVEASLASRNEQALVDFIGKNRGELTVAPAELRRNGPVFLKLAGDALAAKMQRAAIALYQYVPSGEVTVGDAGAPEIVKLAAMAMIHEKAGNLRGALAAYRQLVEDFPQAANREEYFYHLVRTATQVGSAELAALFAAGFLNEFPKSPRAAEVRTCAIGPVAWPPARPPSDPNPPAEPFPESRAFATALGAYQGRKFHDALAAFSEIAATNDRDPDELAFAAYFRVECFRQLGDLDGLSGALKSVVPSDVLGGTRLRQIRILSLCDAVRASDWAGVRAQAAPFADCTLPAGQRAQLALWQGMAAENSDATVEALDFYNTALTADAGSTVEVARQAAIGILRILVADPNVQAALAADPAGAPAATPPHFREAAAVTRLFRLFGGGAPLPKEFRSLLRIAG